MGFEKYRARLSLLFACLLLKSVVAQETCLDFTWVTPVVGEFSLMKIYVDPGSSESEYGKSYYSGVLQVFEVELVNF